jgi:predicted phosphodiesterase
VPGSLVAISDLHVAYVDNRELIEGLFPSSDQDWLIVAGDVGQTPAETEWALRLLSERFAQVIWAPGDHELWATRGACSSGGEARYLSLVAACRRLGVLTPEDPYAVWPGPDGPVTLAPLFLLEEDTSRAEHAGSLGDDVVETIHFGDVCTGGLTRHRGGCPCYAAWRAARVEVTERRLDACDPALPTVLISHFPLMRELAGNLLDPKSTPRRGTARTSDWHLRFRAVAVVHGHLHMPYTAWQDGVRFEEVSVGYPRDWRQRGSATTVLRTILPHAGTPEGVAG